LREKVRVHPADRERAVGRRETHTGEERELLADVLDSEAGALELERIDDDAADVLRALDHGLEAPTDVIAHRGARLRDGVECVDDALTRDARVVERLEDLSR
jgi:hypothetical protein